MNGRVYYANGRGSTRSLERLPSLAYLENRTEDRPRDSSMTTRSSSSAETLYAHIRRLLDEHVFVHLTSYYVDCTQRRVYEVCIARVMVLETDCLPIVQALTGGLLPVSVDDPHSLVLPSDPLDDFIREHCQVELKDMHGRLTAVKEAKELINSSCTVKARPVEGTFTSRFSHTHCGCLS